MYAIIGNLHQSLKQAVKGVLEARHAKYREAEIKAKAPHIDKGTIVQSRDSSLHQ